MKSLENMLKEFHDAYDKVLEDDPENYSDPIPREWHQFRNRWLMESREKMFLEELREFGTAFTAGYSAGMLKEACDVIYSLAGWMVVLGLPLDRAFSVVHKNNMSKFVSRETTINSSGKLLKPESFTPCDDTILHMVEKVIRNQERERKLRDE